MIYIVDDDESARRSIAWLLEASGFESESFASAEEFLSAYTPDMSGCVLLDIRMHGLSGLQLQQRLKAVDATMPIIFISGHVDVGTASEAFRAGACDVLTKPIDDTTLLTRINEAVAEHSKRQERQRGAEERRQRLDSLTPREHEVFQEMLKGLSIKQLAARFGIGFQTAAKHRSRVLDKLACENEVQLVECFRDVMH